ncbi:hypothetical protein, partial [Extibacter muris]|uniref:hypothetical protein n=1 Tax=Extibacter muris TaxID=1796622 RepID=UPI0021C65CE6
SKLQFSSTLLDKVEKLLFVKDKSAFVTSIVSSQPDLYIDLFYLCNIIKNRPLFLLTFAFILKNNKTLNATIIHQNSKRKESMIFNKYHTG